MKKKINFLKIKSKARDAIKLDHPCARVIRLLEDVGAQVWWGVSLERNFAGACIYNEQVIKIGKMPIEEALLTLLHEGGHFLSHLRKNHFGLQGSSFEREFWAFQFGWLLIKWLQLDIGRNTWKQFHEKELLAYEGFLKRVK